MDAIRFFTFDFFTFKTRLVDAGYGNLVETEKTTDLDLGLGLQFLDSNRRAFARKIAAIQNSVHSGRPDQALPRSPPKKATFRIRVARLRLHCQRSFLNGFEKLEPTEAQIDERRHALAQKLIAKTLKQADRRRPRRKLLTMPALWRRKAMMRMGSPLMSCIRWLRQPFVRLARIASLAANAKVAEVQEFAAWRGRCRNGRVRCFPLDDGLPLLSLCD